MASNRKALWGRGERRVMGCHFLADEVGVPASLGALARGWQRGDSAEASIVCISALTFCYSFSRNKSSHGSQHSIPGAGKRPTRVSLFFPQVLLLLIGAESDSVA